MRISTQLINQFNLPNTVCIISSFPQRGGEVAKFNALARYTHLLVSNFPEETRVIVICEKRSKSEKAYLLSPNVLVVPTYKFNNPFLAVEIQKAVSTFPMVRTIHVQFEFSSFGGKAVLFPLISFLYIQKLAGKFITVCLHQVSLDLNELSGHLGLHKGSIKIKFLNKILHIFYKFMSISSHRIIVHDNLLRERLLSISSSSDVVVIPHGTNFPRGFSRSTCQKARISFGISQEDIIIGAFGYLSSYKGTDWIVKTIGQISHKYPEKRIRLLLAGGDSPTLKELSSYQLFKKRLNRALTKYSDSVISLGFVPEDKVMQVFAASDLIVFPYRARMSASGALSLAFSYEVPFLVSRPFSEVFMDSDMRLILDQLGVNVDSLSFSLTRKSFQKKLFSTIENQSLQHKLSYLGRQISRSRSWSQVGKSYQEALKPTYKTFNVISSFSE